MNENIVLTGHTIELRLPTNEDVLDGNWVKWYNDNEITKYNNHGVYPISKETEINFVNKEIANSNSIFLSIVDKTSRKLLGNVCIQNIDLINRHCNLAITIGEKASLTSAFEATALMTHHAFTRLNIKRIEDSTHENLEIWIKMLSLLGYKEEGRGKFYFLKDNKWSSKIMFSAIDEDYFKILNDRNGFVLFEKLEDLVNSIKESVKK
mgnify:CR=1 FL=1